MIFFYLKTNLHHISLSLERERERERERESFDISKNIQVNLIKIEHN